MFDTKFTDRAKLVISIATNFSREIHHEYIGTEHLLLALIRERNGVATHIIANHVDRAEITKYIRTIIQPGPPMVTIGRLPLTPRAKSAVDFAHKEADRMGHKFIGTEHLLLGLALDKDGVACQILETFGMTYESLEKEIREFIGMGEIASTQDVYANKSNVQQDLIRIAVMLNHCFDQLNEIRKQNVLIDGISLAIYHLNESHSWIREQAAK